MGLKEVPVALDRYLSTTRSRARQTREVYAVEGARGVARRTRDWYRKRRAVNAAAPMLPVDRLPRPPHWHTHVLSVAERSLPQCYHYRVEQKREICQHLGVPFDDVGLDDLDEVLTRLQLASVLIVYRLAGSPALDRVIAEADRLGIPVIYEVDDAVYRADLIAENPNLSTLPESLRKAVVRGAGGYLQGMRCGSVNLASTRPLADDMTRHSGRPGFVVENGIDATMLEIVQGLAVEPYRDSGSEVCTVTYGSGSRAHDGDFALAAKGLARWLETVPEGRLTVIGPVRIPVELVRFADRIQRISETLPYGEYLRQLHRSTITIAPLTDDPFNAFKSQVKYLEAGLVGVPIVASPTVYEHYVEDGRTGLLARDDSAWAEALTTLSRDADLRARIATAASEHVSLWKLDHRPREQMASLLRTLKEAEAVT